MATIIVPSQGGFGLQDSTLKRLALSVASAAAGAAFSAQVLGTALGSTVAATSSDGTALTVSGTTVSGVFASPGAPTITLVETLAGAIGSPFTTQVQIKVATVLNALTLSTTSFPGGAVAGAILANITGQSPGSEVTIAYSDTSNRFAVSGDGTKLLAGINYRQTSASTTLTLQEQLPGSITRLTTVGVTTTTTAATSKVTPFTSAPLVGFLGAF